MLNTMGILQWNNKQDMNLLQISFITQKEATKFNQHNTNIKTSYKVEHTTGIPIHAQSVWKKKHNYI